MFTVKVGFRDSGGYEAESTVRECECFSSAKESYKYEKHYLLAKVTKEIKEKTKDYFTDEEARYIKLVNDKGHVIWSCYYYYTDL